MARVATSVQGLRQVVGFFLAYFDYHAAPLQVTCVATSGHRRSHRLHHHLYPLWLRRQCHRLVLDKSTPTTADGFGPSSPLCISQPLWSLVS
jgi:hypothetical protein